MPSKLILDPTEPGISDVIAGAVIGEPLMIASLTVVPTIMDGATMEADIMEIEAGEIPDAEEVEAASPATEAETMMEGMPASETGIDEGVL